MCNPEFVLQQPFFSPQTSGISNQTFIAANNTVTWNDDSNLSALPYIDALLRLCRAHHALPGPYCLQNLARQYIDPYRQFLTDLPGFDNMCSINYPCKGVSYTA